MPSSRPGKVRLKTPVDELKAAGILLSAPEKDVPLDLPAIFGNRYPVEIEIGPGKGAFLIRRASERPEVNFLGVEWMGVYAAYVADRVRRAGLQNVRLLAIDAQLLFTKHLPDASVGRVHIYFPDPWPKKKHHRRRLICPGFLDQVRRVLKIGGWLGIVTDHEEYFAHIRRVMQHREGLAVVDYPTTTGSEEGLIGSNFERKGRAKGNPPNSIAAIRYK